MELVEIIRRVDGLKREIEHLRPIDREQEGRILQKFRLDWNYHSNAIEGNTLTYGETRAFLLHGVTAQGKPFRDYLDIKGHQEAITYLEEFVRQQQPLTEADIRALHKVLLVEPYEMPAMTHEGQPTTRRVAVGQYKTTSNSVRTSTGEMHYYASPTETPALMGDLMKWYQAELAKQQLHPLLLAATFHLRFVNIHPFDDGNGRMARLLMNLILMQAGFVPVIINTNTKEEYLLALEKADGGEVEDFLTLIGKNLLYSLNQFLRGARGEPIEDLADLDKRIALVQKRLSTQGKLDAPEKNIQVQSRLYRDLVQPLLLRLFETLNRLESLFGTTQYQTTYNTEMDNWPVNYEGDFGEQLKNLGNDLQLDSTISLIQLTFRWLNFAKTEPYNLQLQIDLHWEKHQLSAMYWIEGPRGEADSDDWFHCTYNTIYSEDEIKQLVEPPASEVISNVELIEDSIRRR